MTVLGSRRGLAAAGAAAVVLMLAATGCGRGGQPSPGGSGSPAPASSAPASPIPLPTAGTWRMLPQLTTSTSFDQGVWTGTELLFHAPNWNTGHGSFDAAYKPATNSWRWLPSSPYPVQITEAGSQIVWDGTELLTFGVHNGALNPATGVWRPLAAPPLAAPSVVVWTGSQVLIWGGGCCDDATNAGAAYDPVHNTWQALPTAPLAPRRADGVWTGTELVVVGGQAHGESFFGDAAAYNPATRTWRTLPPLPAPRLDATLTWTGTEVLVVGGDRDYSSAPYADGWAYRPASNQWRQLPAMEVGRSSHMAVWTGHYLLVWGGQTRAGGSGPYSTPPHGLAYDPVGNQWLPLPKAPLKGRVGATAVWTGSQMLIWGGRGVADPQPQFIDGAVYQP